MSEWQETLEKAHAVILRATIVVDQCVGANEWEEKLIGKLRESIDELRGFSVEEVVCPKCQGFGRVREVPSMALGDVEKCDQCGGTGSIPEPQSLRA